MKAAEYYCMSDRCLTSASLWPRFGVSTLPLATIERGEQGFQAFKPSRIKELTRAGMWI